MQTKHIQIVIATVLLVLLVVGARDAYAQAPEASQAPARVELFGGYSYTRLNPASGSGLGLNGWASDMQTNIKGPLALATSFSGAYGSESGMNLRLYTLLGGPRLVHRAGKADLFAHALLGYARLSANAAGVSDSSNSFATALGGGLDAKLSRRAAVRVFQTDYLLTRFRGNTQNNFRFSTGIIIRLGGS